MSRARAFIGNLGLALAGVVVAWGIGEAAVRVLDLSPKPLAALHVPGYRLSSSPILLYEYRPDQRADAPSFDVSHRGFATNSAGFRDRERSLEKPTGTTRIVALGDSTTAGNGVARQEDVYAAVLERALGGGGSRVDGSRIEVLNLGVGGYHTLQEAEMLRLKGLAYRPDIVTVGFCLNDFSPDADGGVHAALLRMRELRESGADERRLRTHPLAFSRLAFVLYHRWRALVGRSRPETRAPGATPYAEILRGRSTVEAGFELLASLARQSARTGDGFRVLIFILPGFDRPFSEYRYADLHREVLRLAASHPELEAVDLQERFAAIDDNAAIFSWDGLHLNEHGHAVLARILEDELRGRGLLP